MAEHTEPTTATAQIQAGQPKFQTAVPYGVRDVLGINDIDEDEVACLEVEYELKRIKKKD
jgi:bifunctional DNA-binding transcriptional regulator/antitoxin component of YhaV-PrlF toxin-antitoxin module